MFKWFKKKEIVEAPEIDQYAALRQMQRVVTLLDETKDAGHFVYTIPELAPNVVPAGVTPLIAQDSMCGAMAGYAGSEPQFYSTFIGYPALSWMSQNADYRLVPETVAEEMTREWGKVKGGDEEVIKQIEQRLNELGVRDLMRRHIENDHYFGRSQIFIDIEGQEDKTDLPLLINERGVKKGSLKGFALVEALWSTPSAYNANNPLKNDFFVPYEWYVLGNRVHRDRLMTLIMRPVPDMMKPSYNFGGLPMTQAMKPYVERCERTVDSVSDLVHTYSITGLKTDMSSVLSGGEGSAANLVLRAQIFSKMKNNQNLMLIDKSGEEEFFQLNTPLTTLDVLCSQAFEQMAGPAKMPLVKMFGKSPSGLNATGDSEIRVWYDHVAALQNAYALPQMKTIIDLVQLDLFGKIDPELYWQFNPLYQLDANEQADVDLKKAQTAQLYVDMGVIDNVEQREILQSDEDGYYTSLDMDKDMDLYSDIDKVGETR